MPRLFIGVMLPEGLKDNVILLQDKVKKFVDAKFVERENLHMSLSFLGQTDETGVENISSKLDTICSKHKKFEVKTGKIKFIPGLDFLRVIALDVESDELKGISREVKTKIGGDVKPPHLTLCRVRKIIDKNGLVKLSGVEIKFAVDKISVVESKLSRAGPTYTAVHDSYLG